MAEQGGEKPVLKKIVVGFCAILSMEEELTMFPLNTNHTLAGMSRLVWCLVCKW